MRLIIILQGIGCDIMDILLIDFFGAGLGIFATLLIYETFLLRKVIRSVFFFSGFLTATLACVALTLTLQNTLVLPLMMLIIVFCLSYFFTASVTHRLLLSLAIIAIRFTAEIVFGFFVIYVFLLPIEQTQTDSTLYMFGVLATNLMSLFITFIVRAFIKGNKQYADRQFNLIVAFMPLQAILLCYIVVDYSIRSNSQEFSFLGITAILLSVLLIFITMVILDKQRKALTYKSEYFYTQERLKMQIEHYKEIYKEQHEIRRARHEISNNLILISGLLKSGKTQEAINKICKLTEDMNSSIKVVDHGFPPIDAILNAKISRANECSIIVEQTFLIDDDLHIDQSDIAIVLANALDNAIEGSQRSLRTDTKIILDIRLISDYLSILIENEALGPVYTNFQTSKPDKKSHGFGMTQMKEIVSKYKGSFQPHYDQKAKRFSLRIMMMNHHT